MIELRWLARHPVEYGKPWPVLQYRYATGEALTGPVDLEDGKDGWTIVWSDWQDVPVVKEGE